MLSAQSPEALIEEAARKELLALARLALETYLRDGHVPEYRPQHPDLQLRFGAFVSLHRGHDLRGCIGLMSPEDPLYRTIQRCALSAATEDSRFAPVTYDELPQLTIEISVLTPCRSLERPEMVEVGKHGLRISRGFKRGVLLPQVPAEHHWDRETFLAQTCRKAGLPADAWREASTQIEVFTADVFSEKSAEPS